MTSLPSQGVDNMADVTAQEGSDTEEHAIVEQEASPAKPVARPIRRKIKVREQEDASTGLVLGIVIPVTVAVVAAWLLLTYGWEEETTQQQQHHGHQHSHSQPQNGALFFCLLLLRVRCCGEYAPGYTPSCSAKGEGHAVAAPANAARAVFRS